jgi:tetratricopeptide (TPR) repeat protein
VLWLAGCASQPRIADITQARVLSDHGLDLFNAGDYKGALKALNAVIAFGSVDDRDYTRRAAALGALKEYDKALADTQKALTLAPHDWHIHLQLAYLHRHLGKIDDAIADLDTAVSENPDRVELIRERAYLEVVAARFDDAITDYGTLARIAPRSPTGATGRGVALYLKGSWHDAAAVFERILTRDPSDGLTALWLAKASLRAGLPIDWKDIAGGHNKSDPSWAMAEILLTADRPQDVLARLTPLATHGVSGCELYLFAGAWRVIHGSAQAANEFQAAQKECPTDSIEGAEARVELARLAQ